MKKTIILLALAGATGVLAQTNPQEFEIISDVSGVNHWPGPDGQVGSADDVVGSTPSTLNQSAANGAGSFSYNAFQFSGGGEETTLLPPARNAATFLGGTFTVDLTAAANGNAPVLLNWNVSGTEPFPGHGAYTAAITAVNSGTYNTTSKAFTQNVDFIANLAGGTANSVSFDLAGDAYVIDASEFATGTGNAYVDNVLIPIAQARNAQKLAFIMGTGVVPQSSGGTGGFFPEMPVTAALVGIVPAAVVDTVLNISTVDGVVTVVWNGNSRLQSAVSVSGPWGETGKTSPASFTLSAEDELYFRAIIGDQ